MLLVFISFSLLRQNIAKNSLKEERLILTYILRVFSPWLLGFVASGPVLRQNLMARSLWYNRKVNSWQTGGREGGEMVDKR